MMIISIEETETDEVASAVLEECCNNSQEKQKSDKF